MLNLIFAMAAIGSVYLLDALYEMAFKNNREPLMRFAGWGLVALVVKLLVKFLTWAINF